MKKVTSIISAVVAVAVFSGPVFAQGPVNINKAKQNAGNTITNGSPSASSGASAIGVGSVTTTNTNVNVQDQKQGQAQGQKQGQKQKQDQQANNEGNNQSVGGTNFDRYAPTVVAPSLTAAGTGVCLGSISMGLSGPMAGASFGTTKVDKGCEKRSEAALLFNMGHPGAALRVLAGESIQDALTAEGVMPVSVKAAKIAPKTETVIASVVEPVAVGAVVCKDSELKVTAANGQEFCRAN